jgi:hypothetical protein
VKAMPVRATTLTKPVISPNDRMYAANPDVYMEAGRDAVRSVKWALDVAGKDKAVTILDLLDDGVRFCAEHFGARPIHSSEDPEEIRLPPVDVIWSGSLLTHLPEAGLRGFLRRFSSALVPRGVVVFSTVGRQSVERRLKSGAVGIHEKTPFNLSPEQRASVVEAFDRDGFAFTSGDLEHPEKFPSSGFGWAFCSPDWLYRTIRGETDLQLLLYVEGGWGRYRNEWAHDIVACMKP